MLKISRISYSLLAFAAVAVILAARPSENPAPARDASWAQRFEARYVENLYKIDEGFYRCGQPSRKGFQELYDMGVREILNLRNHHNDYDEARGIGLTLHRIRMNAGTSETSKFVQALKIIDRREGPIAIHCWHGSDRTGIVTALYRMVFQDWPRERALDELINGGYGYHTYYGNIKTYIMEVDVEALRKAVESEK